jgi:NADPH:quinone reductase
VHCLGDTPIAIDLRSSSTGPSEQGKEKAMKAIRCREWGAPETLRLEEAESPKLQPHQVRIRVRAAGVNFADTLMVGGRYQVKPPFPFTPGLEAAGEIVEAGAAVANLRAGQRVLAVLRSGGGYAEEIVLDAAAVVPIPAAMGFVTAAAFPVAYGTSHFALTHRGHLQAGETLLVLGAAGGVGLTAVEIGKAMGARVIAAAGGVQKLEVARSRGADELIDYRTESIRDRVRALTDGKGADVVFDPVGGDAFDQALRAVNWEARMLVIGFAAGRIQAVPANLILVKNISVIGVVWGAQSERDPVLISRNLAELLRWWEAGRLKPLVAKVFPLAEAGAAMNALLSRQYAGKIVLET